MIFRVPMRSIAVCLSYYRKAVGHIAYTQRRDSSIGRCLGTVQVLRWVADFVACRCFAVPTRDGYASTLLRLQSKRSFDDYLAYLPPKDIATLQVVLLTLLGSVYHTQ